MSSVNKVILVGNLGQDPVSREAGDSTVCNFDIATTDKWTSKSGDPVEKTEWHKIVVWGKLAEICQKWLKSGRQVFVEGKLETDKWEDKEGVTRYTTRVKASDVRFLGGGDNKKGTGDGEKKSRKTDPPSSHNGPDDDIPF